MIINERDLVTNHILFSGERKGGRKDGWIREREGEREGERKGGREGIERQDG